MNKIPSEQKLILKFLGNCCNGSYLLKKDYLYVKMKEVTTAFPIRNNKVSLKENRDCSVDAKKAMLFCRSFISIQ